MVGKIDKIFRQGGLLWGSLIIIYLILLFGCGREDETINERDSGSTIKIEQDDATVKVEEKIGQDKTDPKKKPGDKANPGKSGNTQGSNVTFKTKLEEVSVLGEVFGTVMLNGSDDVSLSLEFYRDANADNGGTLLGTASTNEVNGRFNFEIPAEFIDNKTHTLYVYAIIDNESYLLEKNGVSYISYKIRDAAYYINTVQPVLTTNCGSCHGQRELEDTYYNLLSPPPHKGGSATNNQLFRKPNGQLNHGGGNRCAGNNAPCNLIKTWWEREFQN